MFSCSALFFFITCFLAALTECYLVTWNRLYKWIRTSVTHRREGRRRDHRCILITGRHFKCFTKKGWNFLSQHILQKGHMSIYTFSLWQTYTLRVYTAQHPPPFFFFFFSLQKTIHTSIFENTLRGCERGRAESQWYHLQTLLRIGCGWRWTGYENNVHTSVLLPNPRRFIRTR